jgi:hypothetical protein
VYLVDYFGSLFGFHLPTTNSPSCNFRITGRTAHSDQLRSAPSASAATINGRAVWRHLSPPWWLTQLGCDVLEPITTSLSERLRRDQHPSAMPAVWINWTSLDNCCRHSQRWVTVLTYVVTFRPVHRFPDCGAAPRRGMYHNIVCFFHLCVFCFQTATKLLGQIVN